MEYIELIDILAKWAGFREQGNAYYWPDGKFDFAPNFPGSLNACLGWLVPKLQKDYEIHVTWTAVVVDDTPKGWSATLFGQTEGHLANIIESADTAPMALCLAIKKLIEEEE